MSATPKSNAPGASARSLLVPYLWLALFFLVPFLIVLKISLSQTAIAQPPYVPVLDLAAGWQGLQAFVARLTLDGYRLLGLRPALSVSYLKSLQGRRRLDRDPAADRLSDRLRHGARAARGCSRCWSCWWCCRSGPRF